MMRRLGLLVLLVGLVAFANAFLATWVTIDRNDLAVSTGQTGGCVRPAIPSFWRNYRGYPDYDNELIADYFGVYAAYASNAYQPIPRERFKLQPDNFGWTLQGGPIVRPGGFYAELYYRKAADRLSVMMVFRGKDSATSLTDLISENTYFTQMINPWDQYRTARKEFAKIRREAQRNSDGVPVEYIMVGHGLGGGLARHMAAAFPCTAAIVFNSSFISNNRRLAEPYDGQVVDLFADNSLPSRIAILSNPRAFFRISRVHQWYRVRNAGDFSGPQGMQRAAVAMARIPVMCLLRSDCELNKTTSGDAPEANPQSNRTAADMSMLYCLAGPNSEGSKGDLCK
jgi:pimeloyl-ACP methyl ester carboxylesterase